MANPNSINFDNEIIKIALLAMNNRLNDMGRKLDLIIEAMSNKQRMDQNAEHQEDEPMEPGDQTPEEQSPVSSPPPTPLPLPVLDALDEASFPSGAVERATKRAAKHHKEVRPKVFAWQLIRESMSNDEIKGVRFAIRTSYKETVEALMSRQEPKIRLVVETTWKAFKWDELPMNEQMVMCKMILNHLKNNTKVRNWTEANKTKVQDPTPIDTSVYYNQFLEQIGRRIGILQGDMVASHLSG